MHIYLLFILIMEGLKVSVAFYCLIFCQLATYQCARYFAIVIWNKVNGFSYLTILVKLTPFDLPKKGGSLHDHPFIRPGPLLVSLGEMVSLLFSSLSTGIGSVTTLLSAQYHCRTESDDASLCAAAEDAAPSRQHPHWAGLDPLGRRGLAGKVKLI